MSNPADRRNDVRLITVLRPHVWGLNFRLAEFENSDGLAMVHPSVLMSLELVREQLNYEFGGGVRIVITDAVRTPAENEALAAQRGWTDDGGAVSRTSKHLAEYGGIAVDLRAHRSDNGISTPISQRDLGRICRQHFDWVKDDYADGHVHADNRLGGLRK